MSLPGITSIHEHVDSAEAIEILLEAMDRTGVARVNLVGAYASLLHGKKTPDWDSARALNDLVLQAAADRPERFTAFVLIDGREPDPVAALCGYLERGAKGIKTYNGVGGSHQAMPLDDPRLGPLWRFCDLHGVPVLVHVDPSQRQRFLGLVRDHPHVPWICPHLLVLTRPEDLDELAWTLRRHPGLSTDICFGFESWMNKSLERLSQGATRLREIVQAHADQVLFGTDMVVATNRPHRTPDWAANTITEYRKLLEWPRFHHDVRSHRAHYEGDLAGLELPVETLQKLYVTNAARLLDRPPPRWQDDNLDRVLVSLPPKGRLDPAGTWRLLTVAAVGMLSPTEAFTPGKHPRIYTLRSLEQAVARTLGRSVLALADAAAVQEQLLADPLAVGVLPLSDTGPGLRLLPVEGVHPLSGLVARCATRGEATQSAAWGEGTSLLLPVSAPDSADPEHRFDPHEVRSVLLTGTSLLGEGMADEGGGKPATLVEDIATVTQAADVTHLSVENLLRESCQQDLKKWRFCYDAPWLEALDRLGVDVVDLTGNHLLDWKQADQLRTIEAYRERDLAIFGGGEDLERAMAPAVVTIRGLRIGFTGINRLNTASVGAAPGRPGPLLAVQDQEEKALAQAALASDVFFATYQGGYEFSADPWPDMVRYAERAVAAGALGVAGVHAHAPMGVEVRGPALVAYGLGNFLFHHPVSTIPRRGITETGVLLRTTLYGRRVVATTLLPIHHGGERVIALPRSRGKAVLDRVQRGSQEALAPERVLPELVDANVQLSKPADAKKLWRVAVRLGLTSVVVGLTRKAALAAASPQAALDLVSEAQKTWAARGGGKFWTALPLLPGWEVPSEGFDWLRIWLEDTDRSRLQQASASGQPLQVIPGPDQEIEEIEALIAGLGGPVVLSGLPRFHAQTGALAALLKRQPRLYLDTAPPTWQAAEAWFASMETRPEDWRQFFTQHAGRILLASGVVGSGRELGWHQQPRFLRAVRWSLERAHYHQPQLDQGHQGEWGSYDDQQEPTRAGLDLGAEVVDKVAWQALRELIPG